MLVASGIRMDLAHRSPEYCASWRQHHVGGHLKVAPEHTDPDVLMKMHKPANDNFEKFAEVVQPRVEEGRQASNTSCPISSPATRAATWTR